MQREFVQLQSHRLVTTITALRNTVINSTSPPGDQHLSRVPLKRAARRNLMALKFCHLSRKAVTLHSSQSSLCYRRPLSQRLATVFCTCQSRFQFSNAVTCRKINELDGDRRSVDCLFASRSSQGKIPSSDVTRINHWVFFL